jgi:hypothetical protein
MDKTIKKILKISFIFSLFPFVSWLLWYLLWESGVDFPEMLDGVIMVLSFISYFLYGLSIIPAGLLQSDPHKGEGFMFNGYGGGNFFEVPQLTIIGILINVCLWFVIVFTINIMILSVKEIINQTKSNK